MLRKLTNKQGFTLIELMIVIAIIGILAAIAIPNFISYRNKAYCSRVESDARSVIAALSSYFSEPENLSCGSPDGEICPEVLAAQADLTFDQQNEVAITLDVAATPDRYTVFVREYAPDGDPRCPRAMAADGTTVLTYMVVMGGGTTGGWVDDTAQVPAPARFYTMTDLDAFRP